MVKRKTFFSIYIILFSIFGGIFHGSFMALTAHADSMGSSYEMVEEEYVIMSHGTVQSAVEISTEEGSSVMVCCLQSDPYTENKNAFQSKKSELLNLEISDIENDQNSWSLGRQFDAKLPYEYFSPPEKIILQSVIKIE